MLLGNLCKFKRIFVGILVRISVSHSIPFLSFCFSHFFVVTNPASESKIDINRYAFSSASSKISVFLFLIKTRAQLYSFRLSSLDSKGSVVSV